MQLSLGLIYSTIPVVFPYFNDCLVETFIILLIIILRFKLEYLGLKGCYICLGRNYIFFYYYNAFKNLKPNIS